MKGLRVLSLYLVEFKWWWIDITGQGLGYAALGIAERLSEQVTESVIYRSHLRTFMKVAEKYSEKAAGATKNNYRKLFVEKFPDLPKGYQVHHTLPQKYVTIMKNVGSNIHEVEYLKGIDVETHKLITKEWMKWDKALGKTPTAQDVIDFTKQIDNKYNKYWFNK